MVANNKKVSEIWEFLNLEKVLKLEYGKPLPKDKRCKDGPYPVYGANGIKDFSPHYFYKEPSIIIGRKGSAGEVKLTNGPFWPLDVTYFVKFDPSRYNLKFLYNLLLNLQLPKLARGVKPGINRNEVYGLQVGIPPLAEQERIVSILDEAFAAIETATANAEKNLQNARELFQSVLQDTFSKKGDDWVETTLGEVCKFSQGIQVGLEFQKKDIQDGYVRFIRIIDYTQQTSDIRYVKDPGKKYYVNEADLVMVRYGTPGLIGRGINGVIANNLFKIVLQTSNLTNDYLEHFLSQTKIQHYLSSQGSATMPALTFKQLKVVKLLIPPMPAQQAIVKKLDTLSEETKRLESIYERKKAALAELKQSLLQKAFTGQL